MSKEDARAAVEGGAKFISVKNLEEGSLGANLPSVIRDVRKTVPRKINVGAALGDFHERMAGTAAQAAVGAIESGATHHVTVGLYRVTSKEETSRLIKDLGEETKKRYPSVLTAIGVYADHEELGTINPWEALELLRGSKIDAVAVDVQLYTKHHLFNYMSPPELQRFVGRAHFYHLKTILLGSLSEEDVPALIEIGTDLIGVRGSVCYGGRTGNISAQRVKELLAAIDRYRSRKP